MSKVTQKQELQMYRDFFSDLYICRNITMDVSMINHMLSLVDRLGRSWSVGNGELDNNKLNQAIKQEMLKSPWRESSWKSKTATSFKTDYNNRNKKERETK